LSQFVGCRLGTHAIPIVSEVELPESGFTVILYGPDAHANYGYGIFRNVHARPPSFQSYGYRDLGDAHVDETSPPTVTEEKPGVYRVVWGRGPRPTYAVIDVPNRKIVEDSNPANARNQPLTPEW